MASIATTMLLTPAISSAAGGDTLAPSVVSAPQITGDVAVGGSASTSTGSWSGSDPLSYAYQWEDCSTTCSVIAGATTARYVPGASDLGQRLRVVVTASTTPAAQPPCRPRRRK